MNYEIFLENIGVIPISDTGEFSLEGSALFSFASSAQGSAKSTSQDLISFVTLNGATGGSGPVITKPTEIRPMGDSTTVGNPWVTDPDYYELDFFGSNIPSFGIDTIVIHGQRLSPWWGFSWQDLPYYEAYAIWDGGGGGGYAQPSCAVSSAAVDWNFIEAREGHALEGYVPSSNGKPIDSSGVTIGAGFDLGQHNAADLTKLNLGADLGEKLTPFLGLQGKAAQDKLNELGGLEVTAQEEIAINGAVHAATISKLIVQYDSQVGTGAFYTLPGAAQTAIADLSFQYGNLAVKAPSFWNDVISRDWNAAIGELRNFGDKFPTRRNLEADLLQNAMNAGALHQGMGC